MLHTPSYPPLWKSLAHMGRRQVDVPAHVTDTGVSFDYDELESTLAAAAGEGVAAVQPAQPHRPPLRS